MWANDVGARVNDAYLPAANELAQPYRSRLEERRRRLEDGINRAAQARRD